MEPRFVRALRWTVAVGALALAGGCGGTPAPTATADGANPAAAPSATGVVAATTASDATTANTTADGANPAPAPSTTGVVAATASDATTATATADGANRAAAPSAGAASVTDAPVTAPFHHRTVWRFEPSLPLDALSFINALTGDPFYARYYGQSAARFRRLLAPEAIRAVDRLYRRKQQFGFIYSAFTGLLASTSEVTTLEELADLFSRPGRVMAAYRRTEYYRPSHGLLFRAAIARDTVRAIEGLADAGFEAYWRERKLPQITQRIAELEAASVGWNVIPEVERRLGEPVAGEAVLVHVLAFAQPHAAKLVGNQLLVDIAYSNELIAANTIHELLHPPVRWSDPAMRALLRRLDESPLIRTAFDEHDPAFGYNQFQGAMEESIVRVLDQEISERLGLATARGEDRWRYDDGGMHAFAGVLSALMERERYMESDEPVSIFLRRHFVEREITEAELVALWEEGTGRK